MLNASPHISFPKAKPQLTYAPGMKYGFIYPGDNPHLKMPFLLYFL